MTDVRHIADALIRPVFPGNETSATSRPATVVDVTDRTIGLRVGPDLDLIANQRIELGVGGTWHCGRVAWSRHGVGDAVIACVEFHQPAAQLLSAIVEARDPVSLAS